jgi:hypothetical protein
MRAMSSGSAGTPGRSRARQRVGAGQRHAAAARGRSRHTWQEIAVAEHRLAAVVDELADHEVQLHVGRRLVGLAAEEAAGLGEVGRQHAAARAPLEDAPACRQAAGSDRPNRFGHARRVDHLHHVHVVVQVHGPRRAGRAPPAMPCCCRCAPGPMPDSISSCGDCSAPALSSTSRRACSSRGAVAQVLHAGGAPAVEQHAGDLCAP